MRTFQEGELIWEPDSQTIEAAQLTRYMRWLGQAGIIDVDNYAGLWHWSVDHLDEFWESLWAYFELPYSAKWTAVLENREMPGADWFRGARLNYAQCIFSRMTDSRPMMLYRAEDQNLVEISWADIQQQVARLAGFLRGIGVRSGDRVVGYLPNMPEAVVSLLAVASIGAIWSSCSPDFGSQSVLDRFAQIKPKVLIAVEQYQYGGKLFDRRAALREIQTALPDLQRTILVSNRPAAADSLQDTILWQAALETSPVDEPLRYEQVDFSHPLWILYSSGSTGLPKPIVHGHGGIVLEHVKATVFHNDLGPDDRFFWYTSTGWMMWNYLVGGLLSGATIILYNGSPAYPTLNTLFELAEKTGLTYFGTSAAFIAACLKNEVYPNRRYDLSQIRGVGSTGSPLSVDGFAWVYQAINPTLALESLSGGTDLCTAFVGGARILPIYAGKLQGSSLGAKVLAYDQAGQAVIDMLGELVIAAPMPSMPIYFWNDAQMARYRASYFDLYPGIWRHGDWIRIDENGQCIIYGRSDATINRQGIRMGTSEFYRVVEAVDPVLDSLVIDLEMLGRAPYLALFVVLRDGATLDADLKTQINQVIRRSISPRHVPNEIFQIAEVPYTLSGKKMEVPIRKILLGMEAQETVNRGAMRNPAALDFFIDLAGRIT